MLRARRLSTIQSNLLREIYLHNPRATEVLATFLVDKTSAFEVAEKTIAQLCRMNVLLRDAFSRCAEVVFALLRESHRLN